MKEASCSAKLVVVVFVYSCVRAAYLGLVLRASAASAGAAVKAFSNALVHDHRIYPLANMDIPTQDDGFKWFGEGFDGFPKRLPDDCVEYTIHVIDAKLDSLAATRTRLNQILKSSNHLQKKHLQDYIWQREAFELKLHPQPSSAGKGDATQPSAQEAVRRPHLRGRTHFGDSIADGWLVVWLLLELSKQSPDAWIRVYDTDGEFLLIEAASALPKWLNPEIAENRVWISNGHLRIIPIKEGSRARNLTLEDALAFVEKQPDKLIISPFIEDEAFYRLREYPSAISSSMHHALVSIPRNLAFLLHRNPAYISSAIEAFYLRDPVSVKPLATKDISTLQFPPEDFVTVSVKFTKVGYAQLRSQVFDPPPAWTGVIPRLKDPKVEMGMKLACSFEMLLADPQNQDKRAVREVKLILEDIESGDEGLPSNEDLASWPQTQDDEKWLDIDYDDFENELSGRKPTGTTESQSKSGAGFGDTNAQENLRKMVSRFEDFLNDDTAGPDGIDDDEDEADDDSASSDLDSSGEDKDGSYSEAEFEKAMKEMMGMPADYIESSGLLDEARKLAVADADEGSGEEEEVDEDEEMRRVMEIYEKELKGHGALNLDGGKVKKKTRAGNGSTGGVDAGKSVAGKEKENPFFGPERPPNLKTALSTQGKDDEESADEEVGPGDGELSSDDEEFNDVDLGLAKNMLESFKGQAGMAGPAGNLMRSMGINMPRDEGDEDEIEEIKR